MLLVNDSRARRRGKVGLAGPTRTTCAMHDDVPLAEKLHVRRWDEDLQGWTDDAARCALSVQSAIVPIMPATALDRGVSRWRHGFLCAEAGHAAAAPVRVKGRRCRLLDASRQTLDGQTIAACGSAWNEGFRRSICRAASQYGNEAMTRVGALQGEAAAGVRK
jgi:hypothetical protein